MNQQIAIPSSKAQSIAYELYANSFPAFIRKVFYTVSPGHNYVHNWHIDCVSEHLLACEEGEIKNLIINIPPRSLKTIAVSVAWSAWLLGRDPTRQIIGASYSQNLAYKDNTNARYVIESDWYRNVFPDTQLAADQNEKRKFSTTRKGHRIATSVGGTLTGEGGDFLILDDPLKPDEALSDTMRIKTNEWVDQTFMTRKNDQRTASAVLIMQRLHEDDVTGHLLDKGWHHLNLPVESPISKTINIRDKVFQVNKGDLLMPDRLSSEDLQRVKLDVGSFAYAAQYMQSPAPVGGGMIKREWLRLSPEMPTGFTATVQSWDTASKAGELNDFSCCTTWGIKKDAYYLLDVFYKRLEFPELKDEAIRKYQRDKPDYVIIEDKSSGQALIQELRKETMIPIVTVSPTKDKITRLASVSVCFETGNVVLPENAMWLEDLMTQLLMFPNVKHDDIVDSVSQFLTWAHTHDNVSLYQSPHNEIVTARADYATNDYI